MIYFNDGFFVFGGRESPNEIDTIARFDQSTKTWSQVGTLVHRSSNVFKIHFRFRDDLW